MLCSFLPQPEITCSEQASCTYHRTNCTTAGLPGLRAGRGKPSHSQPIEGWISRNPKSPFYTNSRRQENQATYLNAYNPIQVYNLSYQSTDFCGIQNRFSKFGVSFPHVQTHKDTSCKAFPASYKQNSPDVCLSTGCQSQMRPLYKLPSVYKVNNSSDSLGERH